MVRIAEVPTDSYHRPQEPLPITACDVLWNPFDDITPRVIQQEQKVPSNSKMISSKVSSQEEAAVSDTKGVKNLALLSFGEDEEIEEMETGMDSDFDCTSASFIVQARKMKSAHDVLKDERLVQEDAGKCIYKFSSVD